MSQRTESKKWQPMRQKDANKTKFYTFRNGQVNTFDFKEIKSAKKERQSSKQVFHIKKSQTLIDEEERKRNQTKLWHYDKKQYEKETPTGEEDIELNVPENDKPLTPVFEPDQEDVPIKRERSPILVAAPKAKNIEETEQEPPSKKQEPKTTQKRAILVAPIPSKSSKALPPVIDTRFDSKSFESINKSMKFYRF
jgi:hypothetical protein